MEKEVLYFGDMSRKIVDQTECMMIHASSDYHIAHMIHETGIFPY